MGNEGLPSRRQLPQPLWTSTSEARTSSQTFPSQLGPRQRTSQTPPPWRPEEATQSEATGSSVGFQRQRGQAWVLGSNGLGGKQKPRVTTPFPRIQSVSPVNKKSLRCRWHVYRRGSLLVSPTDQFRCRPDTPTAPTQITYPGASQVHPCAFPADPAQKKIPTLTQLLRNPAGVFPVISQ